MKKTDMNKKISQEKTSKQGDIYEWIQCIIVALIVCVVVFVFFVRIVDVNGSSMHPTLENGDKMIVQMFSTRRSRVISSCSGRKNTRTMPL